MSLTPRQLYQYALEHKLADAQIRVCDGMAVSYYPASKSLAVGHYEVVIDVSDLQPVEFDDLHPWRHITQR